MNKINGKRLALMLMAAFAIFVPETGRAVEHQWHDLRRHKPYLYEIWYENYEDSNLTGDDAPFGDLPVQSMGGCSSVRVGDFHGRNLDLGISDTATIVIHMAAGEGRFASVGTTQWADVSETALKAGDVSDHRFDVLPSWMLDGINEKGVAINVNVVPTDVPQLGQEPDERPAMHARKVVRYVLDHAESAENAIERLNGFRIFGNIGAAENNIHWMISDAEKTFVVEIIKGEVVAREHPIMTNFNINWDNGNQCKITDSENWGPEKYFWAAAYSNDTDTIFKTYTLHAEGIERYIRLRDNGDGYLKRGATFEGMFDLMRETQYSKIADLPLEKTYLSDLLDMSEVKEDGFESLKVIYAASNAEKLAKMWEKLRPKMANVYEHLADYRNPETIVPYSITTHNVTFDLKRKMFRIVVQEEYDEPFDFSITSTVDYADTVVYGTIHTAEKKTAEALAIKDGKFMYVGDENGAAAFVKDGVTRIVDHRGKGMVMPGCTDGHSHYTMKFSIDNMKGGVIFDLEDDKEKVLQKLEAAVDETRKAGKHSLFGFGWNIITIRGTEKPTLKELDKATGEISTVIFDQTGHHAFCNSECLRRCDIIDSDGNVLIKEIEGGLLELDDNEYPTGFSDERVTGYFMRMGGIDYDEIVDDEVAKVAILASQELLLSTGYTAMLDGWSNQLHTNKFYEVAKRLDDNGELKLVFPMTYEVEPWQKDIDKEIVYLDSLNKTYRTRHVRPEYLKVFMDGCVESKTGALSKPYKDGTDYKSFWSVDRLADITAKCNAKGLIVHTHVMGDAAIKETADAYIQGGDGTHRNCLVHLRNVLKEDFQRFAANNIACTAGLTWHVSNDKEVEDLMSKFLDEEYLYHAYPIRSFFDAGVKVSTHSDFPANIPCPQDPFGIMEVAITGQIVDSSTGELTLPYDEKELATREQVFEALTINGAWQMGLENERGSIKVGKWADFVLANQDVFACSATDIGDTKVVSTWFEGEKVYEAPAGGEANPWKVGEAGCEVTAYISGGDTLVIKGAGAVWSMPWTESAAGITKLVKDEGVESAEEIVKSLPKLETVNGLARDQFIGAAIGFVKADGFSAIEVKNGEAALDVVVSRADSLEKQPVEWTPVSTNKVEFSAPGEQGFFIVAPAMSTKLTK